MDMKKVGRLRLAGWIAIGVSSVAVAGPEPTAPPMPFEFGPDWRWVPPGELFPPPSHRPPEPRSVVPAQRPEAQRPRAIEPTEDVLRAEALRKAMAPRPAPDVAWREKLDALFVRLAAESDPQSAARLAEAIEAAWLQSGSETADLLMERALVSMQNDQYGLALALLDRLVVLEPGWVEAWNRRAAARFHSGDSDGAMADIDHVLKLEPRHFGALAAMGRILEQSGFERRALEILRRVQAIFPLLPQLREHIDRLETDVDGRGI